MEIQRRFMLPADQPQVVVELLSVLPRHLPSSLRGSLRSEHEVHNFNAYSSSDLPNYFGYALDLCKKAVKSGCVGTLNFLFGDSERSARDNHAIISFQIGLLASDQSRVGYLMIDSCESRARDISEIFSVCAKRRLEEICPAA